MIGSPSDSTKLQSSSSDYVITKPKSLIIFGAGFIGYNLLKIFSKIDVKVTAFLDNTKSEPFFHDLPVFKPSSAPTSIDRNTLVVIGIWRADFPTLSLINELQAAGWKNVITLLDFIRINYHHYGDFYWGTEPGFFSTPQRLEMISKVRNIWADKISYDTFEYLLNQRVSFSENYNFTPNVDEYVPKDIPNLFSKPLRYIDGGAYNGDTLLKLLNENLKFEIAALFEPSPLNFDLLKENLIKHHIDFPVLSWPCALSDKNESSSFFQDDETGVEYHLSDKGNINISCVSVDSVLHNFNPTFIKLDIEGAELLALHGNINTMHKCRPTYAVCVYHKVDDILTIPIWFLDNAKDLKYKFYLRQHSTGLDSHCLYVVPE
jgi:FkbM family methyltransferase